MFNVFMFITVARNKILFFNLKESSVENSYEIADDGEEGNTPVLFSKTE